MSDLVKKTVEEWVSDEDLLWSSPLWRSLFTNWGIRFAADTDSVRLRMFDAQLTESCDEHVKRRMVCVCRYPSIPNVNDAFTVTHRSVPVSVRWLRWGRSAPFLLTPSLFTWPYSNIGGVIVERTLKTIAHLLYDEALYADKVED